MKKALLALAVAGAAVSAQADVKLSGHVNYIAGGLDELNAATTSSFTVNDAVTSQSRFRIISTTKADGITYGARQEFGLNAGAVAIRNNFFWLGGDFGKVSLGQQSETGDGGSENDFSGTYVLNGAAYNSWNAAGVYAFTQIDGGREEALRYDSPKLGGIATVSVDLDTNDDLGLALRLGDKNWKATIYHESRDANSSDEIGGSIAFKAGPITAAVQAGSRDATAANATDDRDMTKFILGYRSGPLSVSVDSSSSEQNNGAVSDLRTTGLNLVYRPTKGVELYAGIRNFDDELGNTDADAYLFGGRVKF